MRHLSQRGFVLVDERMQVIDANGNLVPHLYCIDDANEKMILAYAASAQGISGMWLLPCYLLLQAICTWYADFHNVKYALCFCKRVRKV
ncbi:hypothetical protein CsSME_00053485 [Camellia sinensis var. sinensis]